MAQSGNEDAGPSSTRTSLMNKEEGLKCSMCNLKYSDTHRVIQLRCGHLFGYPCIKNWFECQQASGMAFCCPTCNSISAGINDIRFIYANKLMAVGSHEMVAIQEKIDKTIQENMLKKMMLSREIDILKNQLHMVNPPQTDTFGTGLSNRSRVELCSNSSCRIFDTNWWLDATIVSVQSPYDIVFNHYGITKINMTTLQPIDSMPMHSKPICDIRIHPEKGYFMTASMDKSFKIVDYHNNEVITTGKLNTQLLSCCWDVTDNNMFYIGGQSGEVMNYDIRNTNKPLMCMAISGNTSPVVSIASVPAGPSVSSGTILTCKKNTVWLYESNLNEYKKHLLSVDGPFTSMKYQAETGLLLVSSRPNSYPGNIHHTVSNLLKNGDRFNYNLLHTVDSGMQEWTSKPCIFYNYRRLHLAAYEKFYNKVRLWSVNTGQIVGFEPVVEEVLDLTWLTKQNGSFLLMLYKNYLQLACTFKYLL